MRIHLLFAAMMLALPAAAAGPGATVTTLEGGGECRATQTWESNGSWDEGSWSWWSTSTSKQACDDDFTHADASVHNGDELVGARMGESTSNASHSTSSSSSSGTWTSRRDSYETAYGGESDTASGVTVRTRSGDAFVGSTCADEWDAAGGDASASDEDWRYDQGGDAESYASDCRSGAASDVAGVPVWVGSESACRSERVRSDHRSAHHGEWGSSYEWSYEDAATDSCVTALGGRVDGLGATAGPANSCTSASHAWGSGWSDGNESSDAAWSYGGSECSSGVLLQGPDGMWVFAGDRTRTWTSCGPAGGETVCEDARDRHQGAQFTWAHSPVGEFQSYHAVLP